jgi:hypothetical protein
VALALFGCSPGGADEASPKAPAGGWPGLDNGQLTARMCGLLTKADYKQVGQNLVLPLEPSGGEQKASSNSLSCVGTPGNWLRLELQPTAEAAKVRYEAELAQHKDSVVVEKYETVLAVDVFPASEQSWFDYANAIAGSKPSDYQLVFRRGALLGTLVLDGVDLAKTKDPRDALVRLAGLVLDRAPDIGKNDTGTTPQIRFEMTGTGKTGHVSYFTNDLVKGVDLTNVDLPWSVTVPVADHGDFEVSFNLSVAGDSKVYPPPSVSCTVSINGQVVMTQRNLLNALCSGRSLVH